MKPKQLFHGSPDKIKGDILLPRQPKDLAKQPENLHLSVYATDIKEIAIAMALIKCKGVGPSSVIFSKKPVGIIYKGWPKQDHIYLYTVPSSTFEKTNKQGHQWISYDPIKPIRVVKLAVSDYIHLVRKADSQETELFFKKFGKSKRKSKDI
jgi:hypothetical protein